MKHLLFACLCLIAIPSFADIAFLRHQEHCNFMLHYEMLQKTLQDHKDSIYCGGHDLQALDDAKSRQCRQACWDSSNTMCTENCLKGDPRCHYLFGSVKTSAERNYGHCHRAFEDEVFGLEYSPGLLGSLQPVLESVGLGDFWFVFSYFLEHSVPRGLRKVACYRLFSQIEHMHKHERLFEEECKNMKAKDAHNTTALKHHISYLEGLSPNFASLEYASLDANGRFLCFIGLHRAENESACYQRILDKRLAELREKLHWANRASAVCAEIGVKL